MLKMLGKTLRSQVSNVSKKKIVYEFEAAGSQHYHNLRLQSSGADRFLITPSIIAIADGATGLPVGQELSSSRQDHQYPEKLIQIIEKFAKYQFSELYKKTAYFMMQALQLNKNTGTSTITLCMLDRDTGAMKCFYLGDSVYAIFKEKAVEVVSPQYKSFQRSFNFGKLGGNSDPRNGYEEEYETINKEDLLVVGSNGLWDNVSLDHLHFELKGPNSRRKAAPNKKETVEQGERNTSEQKKQEEEGEIIHKSVEELAKKIGQIAHKNSMRGNFDSPIYLRAKQMNIKYERQGKMDDVTVVVAQVVRKAQIK